MNNSSVERFGKHVLAVLVLLLAAWIVIKLVVGIVAALFVPLLVIGAIVAFIWAWRVLF
jgi:H+/Cl- antiporter ClcA